MTQLAISEAVDAGRWPDVERLPESRMRASIARQLVKRVGLRMPLRVSTPDGVVSGRTGPMLHLVRPDDFYQRLGVGGLIGFGEAYQAGDWDTDDVAGLLQVMAHHVETIVPRGLQWPRRFCTGAIPSDTRNTLGNAARNIESHYDLSNDLFRAFLDESMTYSSALFGTAEPTWANLAAAQRRKIDRLLDLTGVGPGSRVLEIGTGWGELAIRAAERGATVHSVTLSHEQKSLAEARAGIAGVDSQIDVRLCDYREIKGESDYDVVISVEMIEAVGEEFWPDYFSTLRRLVTPEGRIGIQAITMPHHRMLRTRRTHTWIQKYIFPGGLIPSPDVIEAEAGLPLVDRHEFGLDYAQTLRLWRERFLARFDIIRQYGFDDVFRRTWELYLAYSQAGFAAGYLNVGQYVFGRASVGGEGNASPRASTATPGSDDSGEIAI